MALRSMKLLFKETYFDDLDDIADYITACFSEDLAHEIVQEIHSKCIAIVDQRHTGRPYPRNPFFHFVIIKRKNVLFYRIDESAQTVTLHRIFDTRRDYTAAVNSLPEE